MGGGQYSSGYGIQGSISSGSQSGFQSSSGSSFSESKSKESQISKKQYEILKSRQEYYQDEFIPRWESAYAQIDRSLQQSREMAAASKKENIQLLNDNMALIDNAINAIGNDYPVLRAAMALQSTQINNAYDAAQKQTAQNLAKQNLLGYGNGISAVLNAQNERARASALSQAYNTTILQNDVQNKEMLQNLLGLRTQNVNTGIAANQSSLESSLAVENAGASQRNAALQTIGALMPQPTNDVAYHQYAMSMSSNKSFGANQGKQSSQSFGENWSKGGGGQINV